MAQITTMPRLRPLPKRVTPPARIWRKALPIWDKMMVEEAQAMTDRLQSQLDAQALELDCRRPEDVLQAQIDLLHHAFLSYISDSRDMMQMICEALEQANPATRAPVNKADTSE